jgi:hypothetical protein
MKSTFYILGDRLDTSLLPLPLLEIEMEQTSSQASVPKLTSHQAFSNSAGKRAVFPEVPRHLEIIALRRPANTGNSWHVLTVVLTGVAFDIFRISRELSIFKSPGDRPTGASNCQHHGAEFFSLRS